MNSFKSSINNPWFTVTMGFAGIIVGYGIAMGTGATSAPTPSQPAQVVKQPTNPTPTPPPAAPTAKDVKPVDPNIDHIRGNPNAAISVIEYSDYECPFCARHHPTMQQLVDDYGDDVNWVYRHYPLGFHDNAQIAAEAAECANELGGNDAFWSYSDVLFEKGVAGKTREDFITFATDLNLETSKFTECLDSGKYTQHVKDDMASGAAAGVSGTPGNIVYNNNTKEANLVSGAQPVSAFKAIIDPMLQ
jgi:protein-disulfide isomerase